LILVYLFTNLLLYLLSKMSPRHVPMQAQMGVDV